MKKRKFVRFTCAADIFTDISYGCDDEYLRAGGSGFLVIHGPDKQKAKVVDLSLGGAKLLTKSPIHIGAPVTVRIEISPNAPSIEGKAKVVWWKSMELEPTYLVGVVFNNLGWRERFRLKKLIKRMSKEP